MNWILASEQDPVLAIGERCIQPDSKVQAIVAQIIEDVLDRGDAALLESARRFDAPGLASIQVTDEELESATIPAHHAEALHAAAERIRRFHAAQLDHLLSGWSCGAWQLSSDEAIGQRLRPVRRAGIYVPGGKAAYPSSVLMNAGPARAAGVAQITLTTPARRDGTLPPPVLVACRALGLRQVIKVGGAAAVAALALGTDSIRRVDVIAGPGNAYVNEAKRQLWGTVGLDGYAGPSEVCILADETTNVRWAAADLLTQIEHAEDNLAFLVSTSMSALKAIEIEACRQASMAPRKAILEACLEHAIVVHCLDDGQAIDVVNAIAPEHLSLLVQAPADWLPRIENAGCILMGEYTPESAGDFALGPSHTLPTSGAARFTGPVNVLTFMKLQSLARADEGLLRELTPVIEAFGEMEGFPTHAGGASIRWES